MPKLIIIRGPSGSGKSTISNELLKRSKQSLLVVSEDKLRKMFSDHRSTPHPTSEQMAIEAIKLGLNSGYHVVYQGILNVKNNEFRPEELLAINPGETYFFYLDTSFEETVRRHKNRHKRNDFGTDAMKRWRQYSSPLNHELETLTPGSSDISDTLQIISDVTKLEII